VNAPGVAGAVVNVATGSRISLNRLFHVMRQLTGSTVDVNYGPVRDGDVKDSLADITRARTLLGYEPFVSFEEGLHRTLEWYRAEARS
jgi:nucleoside-diphosphate-sugar epimerase